MISINNRRMIVPPEERGLGVFADDYSSIREFSIPRKSMRDIDPSDLTFRLDFMHKDGTKNVTVLEKIIFDDEVKLTWNIIAEDLRVDGTVLLQVHGNDLNGTVRWASYMEPFYIGNAIDTAGSYTGELSALEALLTRVQIVENAEQDRMVSEQQRRAGETTRVSSENERIANEDIRIVNESDRQSSINDIETRFHNLTTSQQQDAEVIVARGDKASLGQRLDGMEGDFSSQLAETVNDIQSRAINVKYPPFPYVGAKGDGITDDTIALNTLLAVFKNIEIPSGEYLVSDTIVAKLEAQVVDARGVYLVQDTPIENKAILQLGDTTKRTGDLNVTITEVRYKNRDVSFKNYGIIAYNLYTSKIRFGTRDCETGFLAYANDGMGNVYNQYEPTAVWSCKYGFDVGYDGTGWTNENIIVGGRFGNAGDEVPSEVQIRIKGNSWHLYSPSIEGTVNAGILMGGMSGAVYSPRTEIVAGSNFINAIHVTGNFNRVVLDYYSGEVTDDGMYNDITTRNILKKSFSIVGGSPNSPIQYIRDSSTTVPLQHLKDTNSSSGTPKGIRYDQARGGTGFSHNIINANGDIVTKIFETRTNGVWSTLELAGGITFDVYGLQPEGNLSRNAGSLCLTPVGVFFKESGTDKTGWIKLAYV